MRFLLRVTSKVALGIGVLYLLYKVGGRLIRNYFITKLTALNEFSEIGTRSTRKVDKLRDNAVICGGRPVLIFLVLFSRWWLKFLTSQHCRTVSRKSVLRSFPKRCPCRSGRMDHDSGGIYLRVHLVKSWQTRKGLAWPNTDLHTSTNPF